MSIQTILRAGPMPGSRQSIQNELRSTFWVVLSHDALFKHFFYLMGLFLKYYGFWVGGFFLMVLYVFHAFPLFYPSFPPPCFLKREKKKAWSWKGGAVLMCGRSQWRWGKGNCDQNILYGKNLFFNKNI